MHSKPNAAVAFLALALVSLVNIVALPIIIALVLLIPVSAIVACAGLLPSFVSSLLVWVINQGGYPAALKIMFSLIAFPFWLSARLLLVPSTAYLRTSKAFLRVFFETAASGSSEPGEDAAPVPSRSSNGHRP